MPSVRELKNGKLVCRDHLLVVCPYCTMDLSFAEAADGEEDDDEIDEYESAEEDDRVFVLSGGTARFMPQWDEQILGPANTYRIEKDYENPPKPLSAAMVKKYDCLACNLTWLVGENGEAAAKSHPSHHTYQHDYCGTNRSLIVYTDGACEENGSADSKAGVGIFFQAGSKYNVSEGYALSDVATSQKAELQAIARALEHVRTKVLPDRIEEIKNGQHFLDKMSLKDIKDFRLIVTTDSSYAVEGICSNLPNWSLNEKKDSYRNKAGKAIKNSSGFLNIIKEVEMLAEVGVQVVYHLVKREENLEADALACSSLEWQLNLVSM
ncbi:ribonuclease H-like protein [Tothia fuscella]|uniref:ribonuclease H n=1 Tax=Tothia fuscella TaxID=1048955 RepID=A0A9P4NUD8_9PEZI|nr:ribonuclease H-like protein [Tothia fuscella]